MTPTVFELIEGGRHPPPSPPQKKLNLWIAVKLSPMYLHADVPCDGLLCEHLKGSESSRG